MALSSATVARAQFGRQRRTRSEALVAYERGKVLRCMLAVLLLLALQAVPFPQLPIVVAVVAGSSLAGGLMVAAGWVVRLLGEWTDRVAATRPDAVTRRFLDILVDCLIGSAVLGTLQGLAWWGSEVEHAGLAAVVVALPAVLWAGVQLLAAPPLPPWPELAQGSDRHLVETLAARDGVRLKSIRVQPRGQRGFGRRAYVAGSARHPLLVVDAEMLGCGGRNLASVCAHELWHLRRHHREIRVVCVAAGLIAVTIAALASLRLWAVETTIGGLLRATVAAIMVQGLVNLLLAAQSRRWESAADRHALEQTRDSQAMRRTLRALAGKHGAIVDAPRWIVARLDHPPLAARLAAITALEHELSMASGSPNGHDVGATKPAVEVLAVGSP